MTHTSGSQNRCKLWVGQANRDNVQDPSRRSLKRIIGRSCCELHRKPRGLAPPNVDLSSIRLSLVVPSIHQLAMLSTSVDALRITWPRL